jgi:hypothetical protein
MISKMSRQSLRYAGYSMKSFHRRFLLFLISVSPVSSVVKNCYIPITS